MPWVQESTRYGKRSMIRRKLPRHAMSSYRRVKRAFAKGSGVVLKGSSAVAKSRTIAPLLKQLSYPFQQDAVFKLKYSDQFELAATAGQIVTQTYRLNSLYDPDLTGTGAQPRYYDQLFSSTAPYGAYCVLGAKVKVKFVNDNTSPASAGWVAIRARSSNTPAITGTDYSALSEMQNTKYTIINSAYAKPFMQLQGFYNTASIIGVKDIEDDEDANAEYNANPVDQALVDVHYAPIDLATTTSIYCIMDITYIVKALELRLVDQS